jgi:hypothetical protein
MASFHGPQILNLENPLHNYGLRNQPQLCSQEVALMSVRFDVAPRFATQIEALTGHLNIFFNSLIYAWNRSLLCAQDEEILHSVKDVLDVINQTTAQAERGDHRLNLGVVITLT